MKAVREEPGEELRLAVSAVPRVVAPAFVFGVTYVAPRLAQGFDHPPRVANVDGIVRGAVEDPDRRSINPPGYVGIGLCKGAHCRNRNRSRLPDSSTNGR